MGKRQHQKDKMYITHTEWTTIYGGKRSGTLIEEDTSFKRLPFDHCCLCLQPFNEPFCDADGNIFELQPVIPFLKKFKVNPVTGKKIDIKSLIKLNFFKNSAGEYHCPVLFKPFTKNSHIVAISTSGNVYCYEAVEQLNIKGKNWKDLINDTPFTRADIITIQDPNHLGKFNISNFHHIKNSLRIETEEEIALKKDPHARLKTVSAETRDILQELDKEYKAPENNEVKKEELADKFNAAHYSTGMVAASFTSTAMVPETTHQAAILCEDEVKYDRVKKKGYVRLVTNLGQLNFELYCDVTPKACDNFIKHCLNGYYNGTKFHRSIRNFMIQGGDPTGTGLGGESIWKKPFEDELKPNLHHTGRGVLAMANSGPNTNGSQFFITFRSCKQLDGKHTIFGKLVGGLDTLSAMEQIEVDNKDRPIQDIIIEVAQVFVDPFAEAEEQLALERAEEMKKRAAEQELGVKPKKGSTQPLKVFRDGVGKYLNLQEEPSTSKPSVNQEVPAKKAKKDGKYNFGTFESW
ncbi:RING-type E3 ubiquitin-protein ligase PPIL2 [Vanessa atalanta]|uniref:RING-type E3 ubiquitin-protein ligase PPIL2 n=1 Tax=Vanessa atalanta TaxID=42275 RepID=UPI001FCE2ED4|nr:RING-type E3 ubiquitin-protein ligase PPIL2 [Vanessa atalanta]